MHEFHINVLVTICEIMERHRAWRGLPLAPSPTFFFLLPRPQVLGKGIPNITAGEDTGTSTRRKASSDSREEKADSRLPSAMKGANNSVLSEAAIAAAAAAAESGGRGSNSPTAALRGEHGRHAPDASAEQEDGKNAESGVDKRIHLLDCARRQMAHAGAMAAAACIEAAAALEVHDGQPTSPER